MQTADVKIESRYPVSVTIDMSRLAEIFAGMAADQQAAFFTLAAVALETACAGKQWFQIDSAGFELAAPDNAAGLDLLRKMLAAADHKLETA